MRVRRRYRNLESQPEDQFGSSNSIDHQPQSFGDFAHGTALHRPETKLTCPSPTTTTGARGPRFHAGDEVPYTARDPSFTRQTGRSTSCASFPYHYNYTYYNVYPKGRQAHSLSSYRGRQWNPCHMDFWSCSSKPLTGRTGLQTEGRFSLLEPLEIHPGHTGISPTTGQGLIVRR